MPGKKYLIVIGGPTASGKTSFAIKLAQHFQTEILSADSRQFYQEMSIGTAKPNTEELQQVQHHFINNLSIKHQYNIGQYESEGLALLNNHFKTQDVAVLVGGSGLYIKALCEGLDNFPEVPLSIRQELEQVFQTFGIVALQEELAKVDPDYYARVDTNNPHRLIRALAVFRASGAPFSDFQQKSRIKRSFQTIYLQLQWPRVQLYQRINQRVDLMMEAGLLDEARKLLPYQNRVALQTVGYQELFEHFAGKHTLEVAIELIKRNSRRYAKRQLTWNRREGFWKHLKPEDFELALQYIELVRNRNFRIYSKPLSSLSSSLPLTFTPSNTKEPGRWICGSFEGQIQFLLLKEVIQKRVCFSHFYQQMDRVAPLTLDLFAHEVALQSEDHVAYLIIPLSLEPFFHKYGFQNVARESIPGKIQARWTALQHLEGLLIMQKPSLAS